MTFFMTYLLDLDRMLLVFCPSYHVNLGSGLPSLLHVKVIFLILGSKLSLFGSLIMETCLTRTESINRQHSYWLICFHFQPLVTLATLSVYAKPPRCSLTLQSHDDWTVCYFLVYGYRHLMGSWHASAFYYDFSLEASWHIHVIIYSLYWCDVSLSIHNTLFWLIAFVCETFKLKTVELGMFLIHSFLIYILICLCFYNPPFNSVPFYTSFNWKYWREKVKSSLTDLDSFLLHVYLIEIVISE